MDLKEKLRDQNMKFRQNLFDMFMNGRYTDVTLVCDEGTEVWAHKFVLASASSVLKGMFKEDANKPAERQVIRIAGASYPDLIALIQWVYLGFFKVTEVTGNMVDIAEGLKIDLGIKASEANSDGDNDDPDDPNHEGDDDRQEESVQNVKPNIQELAPVKIYDVPAPMLVNDDGTVVPVEQIQAKAEYIEPVTLTAAKKDPVKVNLPSSNLSSNNVTVKLVEKPTNTNIMDFNNEMRKNVLTPMKKDTILGQSGSVAVKVVKRSDGDKKEEAKCPVCQKKYLNRMYMVAHYKKEHSKTAKKFACVKCNFKAPYDEQVMTAHLRMHELTDASQKSYTIAGKAEKEIFHSCGHCNLKFRSFDYLKLHLDTKHFTKYPCPSCDFEATSKEALKVHNACHLSASKTATDHVQPKMETEAREDGEVDMSEIDSTWSVVDAVPMISGGQQNKVPAEMNFLKSWGSK